MTHADQSCSHPPCMHDLSDPHLCMQPEGADSVVARPVSAAARPGEPGKGPERRKRGPDTRNKGPGKAAPVQEQPPVSARVPYNTVKELFTASATKAGPSR